MKTHRDLDLEEVISRPDEERVDSCRQHNLNQARYVTYWSRRFAAHLAARRKERSK